jgi:very-short-patch-repair endonuclease
MKTPEYWQSRCSKFRAELLNRQTESEHLAEKWLKENEIAYIPQKGFFAGGRTCIVDFYLPKHKCCLEIDGGYHFTDEQMRKDELRDFYLNEERNLKVVRISNEVVSNEPLMRKVYAWLTNAKRGERIVFS